MKIINLKKFMDGADQISHGVDYLRLNLREAVPGLASMLRKLDDDNANMLIDTIGGYPFTFVKSRVRGGSALTISISLDNVSYSLWQYVEYIGKTKKKLKSVGYLVYYGVYFRLLERRDLSSNIEGIVFKSDLGPLSRSSVSRLDYRIDFFYKNGTPIIEDNEVVKYRKDTKKDNHFVLPDSYEKHKEILNRLCPMKSVHYDIKTTHSKGGFQNGWSLGNKKNRSIYIRCYEKLIETIGRGKVLLYDDYFLYKNVFRLEVEFLSKFNKRPDGTPFLYSDIAELKEKIFIFFGLSDAIYDGSMIYQYKNNNKTDFTRLKRQKEFAGRGFTLYEEGFNPFIILYKLLEEKMNVGRFTVMIVKFKQFLRKREADIINEASDSNGTKNG